MSHEGDRDSSLKKDLSQTIFGPKADDDDKAATTKFIDYTLEKVKSGELIIHRRSGPHEPSRNECEDFERLSDGVFINHRLNLSQHSPVYLGAKKDGKEITLIAVKIIELHGILGLDHDMLKEAEAIQKLQCDNIIGYVGCGFTRDINFPKKSFYLAMEICDQETLYDNVNKMKKENLRFTNRDCMSIAKQLANALKVVHEAKLKHGDIKPSNVLFKIGRKVVKLSDFSLQNPLRHHHYYSHKRVEWIASESFRSGQDEESSDVFALALTIYYAWSNGKHAFGDDPNSQYWNIAKNRGSNLANTPFKPKGEQLILLENMLLHDYKKRPTAEQVYKEPCIQNAKDRLEYPEGEKISLETNFKYTSEQDQEGECIAVLDRRSKSMNAFTPSSRMWTSMQAIKEDIVTWELTVALLNNRIFTLLQNRAVYSIDYNVPNARWIKKADLILEHGDFPSAAALGEHLYVVGGSQRETEVVKEGEVFHNEEWGRIRDMNTSRKGHSLVACKDCIYSIGGWEEEEVVGGLPEEGATAKGEKYDPKTDVWSLIQSMKRVRYAPAAASLGEKIYVLGGQIESGSMLTEAECYDANTDCWTFLANMNIRRSFFSAVAVGGKMYAVAGDDVVMQRGCRAPQTIEEYDPETKTWRQIQELKSMEIWPKGSLAVTRRKIAL